MARLPLVCLTHPFELGLGVALVATLAKGLLTGQVTNSIDTTLPDIPRILYQVVSGLAGVTILVGLLSREKWQPGRGVEQAGLWLAAGAFIGYAIILGSAVGWSASVNVGTSFFIGVSCVLRALAIGLSQAIELRALRIRHDDEDVPE